MSTICSFASCVDPSTPRQSVPKPEHDSSGNAAVIPGCSAPPHGTFTAQIALKAYLSCVACRYLRTKSKSGVLIEVICNQHELHAL